MKTTFETIKHVVTITMSTRKCVKGEYVIMPALVYTKEEPRKEDNGTTVAMKALIFGWLKGYVEIEWIVVTKKN